MERENKKIVMVTEPLDYNGIVGEVGESRWTGIPKNTIIGHIHLHVGDLQKILLLV